MKHRAFTLIELLIVVAIIAILAAIAVPNFLEAQVRAKVSRAKADIRTLATALESYRVDWNNYPNDFQAPGYYWYVTNALSTPVSYITDSWLGDPFRGVSTQNHLPPRIYGRFRYVNYVAGLNTWPLQGGGSGASVRNFLTQQGWEEGLETWGQWKLSSAGPDRTANSAVAPNYLFLVWELIYDPTNGTVSYGDIVRSQREPDVHPDELP